MRYPTAYRPGAEQYSEGLSNEGSPPQQRLDFQAPMPIETPNVVIPKVPGYVVPRNNPFAKANPWVAGFMAGWQLGVFLWGDPFDTAPETGSQGWTPGAGSDYHYLYVASGCSLTLSQRKWKWQGVNCGGTPAHDLSTHDAVPPFTCSTLASSAVPSYPNAPYTEWPYCPSDPDTLAASIHHMQWNGLTGASSRHKTMDVWRLRSGPHVSGQTWESGFDVSIHDPVYDWPVLPSLGNPSPIMQPTPLAIPLPWDKAVATPGSQPSHPDFAHPTVRVPPLPMPFVVAPTTVVRPGPIGGTVTVQPEPVVVVVPGDGPPVVEPPGGGTVDPPVRRPPGSKTKESKVNVRSVSGKLWGVINLVTEGLDFLDVLHDSLAKEHQAKKKTRADYTRGLAPQAKIAAVYEHFETLDIAVVVENFINNQFEDLVYGTVGQTTGRATRNIGANTGLDRAVRGAEGNVSDFTGETLQLPELVYDPETGKFWVDGGTLFVGATSQR